MKTQKLMVMAALLSGCGLFTSIETAPPEDDAGVAASDTGSTSDIADGGEDPDLSEGCDADVCESTSACDPACEAPETCQEGVCACPPGDEDCAANCFGSPPDCSTMGVCTGGTAVCDADGWTCGPGYEAREVTCDGKDNDCDGTPDNLINKTCTRGVGVCQTTAPITCEDAEEVCTAMAGIPEEASESDCSDGRDTDCDGFTDCDDEDCLGAACGGGMTCQSDGTCG